MAKVPKYRYIIHAQNWTKELQSKFGKEGEVHNLTDTQVVDALDVFDCPTLVNKRHTGQIYFYNG